MTKLTDQELIEELLSRFADKRIMLEEQKRLMKQLKVVNKKLGTSEALKSHFLSNIKNEINNPLSSILGLSRNMSSLKNLNMDKVQSTSDLIYSEAFNLDFQLKNIFAAADLEAGESYPTYNKTDIHQVIKSVIASYDHRARRKFIQIEFSSKSHSEKEPLYFYTDSEKLSLIISNLVSNGLEFNHTNSTLQIITNLNTDETLTIDVIDYGIGIEKENQIKIFDRFFQLESGTTKTYSGQGLGLSITQALIDLLSASIFVESEAGKGSQFNLVIPNPPKSEIHGDVSDEGNEFLFDADETF
jgi:signal transduction histidine kinase